VEAKHVFRLLVMASLLRLHICCSAAVKTNQRGQVHLHICSRDNARWESNAVEPGGLGHFSKRTVREAALGTGSGMPSK
jgi:hypothetical protein